MIGLKGEIVSFFVQLIAEKKIFMTGLLSYKGVMKKLLKFVSF